MWSGSLGSVDNSGDFIGLLLFIQTIFIQLFRWFSYRISLRTRSHQDGKMSALSEKQYDAECFCRTGKRLPVGKSRASEGRDPSSLEDYAERRRDYAKGHTLSENRKPKTEYFIPTVETSTVCTGPCPFRKPPSFGMLYIHDNHVLTTNAVQRRLPVSPVLKSDYPDFCNRLRVYQQRRWGGDDLSREAGRRGLTKTITR